MKTGNIANKKIFKYDEYSHGIDYLSFGLSGKDIVKDFFTERIFNLDTDNSNFGIVKFHDELLSIHKYKSPQGISYQFSCTYESVSIPVFVITEYSHLQSEFCNNSWGIIHFYGSYFRLIELNHFSDGFIWSINKLFLDSPVSRMDYRYDFCSYSYIPNLPTVKEVLPNIRKNKKVNPHGTVDNLESWDIGNKKNKTVFIRLYNKLIELGGNIKKTYLYSDIDKFKTFTRLEYEFGNKWCFGYTGKDIESLINKAFKTSGIEPSSFKGNLYKPQLALDLSDKVDQLRYIKIFLSMAKNLKNNGIDPISLIKKQGI